jgi:6-phosphogluconolactonase (cycloisomerase 2 family)
MMPKRSVLLRAGALFSALLLSGCQGFFTNTGSSSSGLVTGTGTVSSFAYAANTGTSSGSVSAYTVGGDNTLTAVSGSPYASSATNSISLINDPDANNLYVANVGAAGGTGSIDSYAIDRSTGQLTVNSGSPFVITNANNPTALAISTDGSLLCAAYGSVTITASDGTTSVSPGIVTLGAAAGTLVAENAVGVGSSNIKSMVVNPSSGTFLYASNGSAIYVFGLDSSTGTLTATAQAGSTPLTQAANQITVAPNGKFAYVAAGSAGVAAYSINNSTGVLTLINTYSTGGTTSAITVDPTSAWAYAVNSNTNKISAYSIGSTGALTGIGTYSTGSTPQGIAIGPSGTAVYVANAGSNQVGVYTINADGTLNFLGNNATNDSGPQSIVVTK